MKRPTFVMIGLGLIGGSLGAALRKRFPGARVVGVSRSRVKIRLAKKKRLIHEGSTRLTRALRRADLIFICTPVDTIPHLLAKVDRAARPGTIVTDVGSVKREIVKAADSRRFRNIRFCGSHPLAGSHVSGLAHVQAALFDHATVFLTPTPKTDPTAQRVIQSIWKRLGARVLVLSPRAHDEIVSQVSHLPHAIASCLMHVIHRKPFRLAAAGFRDTTRVAQGEPHLWRPIFLANRDYLVRDLRQFSGVLARLAKALKRGSGKEVEQILRIASAKRKAL